MAYPNYQAPYQTPYNPYLYPQMYAPPVQQTQQTQQQSQPIQAVQQPIQQPVQPQIQNTGFLAVHSVDEAYNWPIAPGAGMTFKIENAPVVCTKSRGFSPLEEPVFKIYDMIERVPQQTATQQPTDTQAAPQANYVERADFDALQREIESFKAELETLKNQPLAVEIKRPTSKAKKEADE